VNAVKDHLMGGAVAEGRMPNARLSAVIAESRWSHGQIAAAFVRVAVEVGAREFAQVGRSHVSHWVAGSHPSGAAPMILCEALSRRVGRIIAPEEIGLSGGSTAAIGRVG
jgi:hypothetical protein